MKRLLWLILCVAACGRAPTPPLELGDVKHCTWELDSLSGLPYCDYGALPQRVAH